ncbi:hypothetical protein Tco_1246166 [Tanacetum coccineum]
MTMNKLPLRYIGLYIEQFEQGGLRVPFSSFLLAVIRHFGVHVSQLVPMGVNRGHWFSFENKTGRGNRKCFKEITSILKGWKRFFLLDRRAIPDAMPWRHSDTDLHDDFPTHFNENDVDRLSEFQVPLRPPPGICWRSPSGRSTPKARVTPPLPVGTAIPALTPFQKNLEKPNLKIAAAREKKDQQNLAKAEAKRACAGTTGAIPETTQKPAITASEVSPDVEKEVVDLSGNTRVSPPPVINVQSSPHQEYHGTHEIHSQSSHHGSEDEPVGNRYVPNWRLRNDLRFCTFRACKELVSHLATPAEDEFLGALSNVEVISRAYQTLGQSVVAQGELLKRHEQLNHDYVDLRNCNDAYLLELDHPRSSARRTEQENEGLNNKLSLIESAHSGCESREKELMDAIRTLEKNLKPKTCQLETAKERIKVLEGEKLALSAELARAGVDRQKLVREFIPAVVKRLHTSVESEDEIAELLAGTEDLDIEGSKSWEEKHRELFTKQYPYVQKVADSYLLPMTDLLRVSPDVPTPRPASEIPGSAAEQTDDTALKPPPPNQETAENVHFGTTT